MFNTGLQHMPVTNRTTHITQRNTCFRHCSVSLWFFHTAKFLCLYCLKWQTAPMLRRITADKVTASISRYKEMPGRQEYENCAVLYHVANILRSTYNVSRPNDSHSIPHYMKQSVPYIIPRLTPTTTTPPPPQVFQCLSKNSKPIKAYSG